MVKLLANLRKIFNKKAPTNSISYFSNKGLLSILSLSTVIFTNNSLASSWITKNSLLIKNFNLHEDTKKYSTSLFIEERIPNSDCSIGMNIFNSTSKILQREYNNTSFFYKCKISDKKNKLITLHFPMSIDNNNKKTELAYGIGISNGSSKIFRKKTKNKLMHTSVFRDWRCDFILSSNKDKKSIYKVQKASGVSFKTIEFILVNTLEEYNYRKSKVNNLRADIKICLKINQKFSVNFGVFKIIHFEKNETQKSKQFSSGFGFGFSANG